MSACPSSPILDAFDQLDPAAADIGVDSLTLLAALSKVADPRKRRGVRHHVGAVLAVGVGAVLTGAKTFTAIAEWAHDLPPAVRSRLGFTRAVPSESTIRRVLQATDADDLDAVVSDWLAARAAARLAKPAGRRVIAVDGKTARGARCPDGRHVHLLGAPEHPSADGARSARRR